MYSNCSEARKVSSQPGLDVLVFESITGFVYNNKWYLAVTLQTFLSTEEGESQLSRTCWSCSIICGYYKKSCTFV